MDRDLSGAGPLRALLGGNVVASIRWRQQLTISALSSDDLASGFATTCGLLSGLIRGQSPGNLTSLLGEITPLLGLKHLVFTRFDNHKGADAALASVFATYPQSWQLRYVARGYADINSVFSACRKGPTTFDWRAVQEHSTRSTEFLADAIAHGVGRNGLTIPVPLTPTAYAMVSFNSDLPDGEWHAYKKCNMAKLEIVACLIEAAAARNSKLPSRKIDLSNREHQALSWAARGKTAAEIGEIMGISYATARSHLEGARRKLDCDNVTHAASTALATGLISPMALKGSDPAGYDGKEAAAPEIRRIIRMFPPRRARRLFPASN